MVKNRKYFIIFTPNNQKSIVESIYFKILGVTLVLTVSCGTRVLCGDADQAGYAFYKSSDKRNIISVASSSQSDGFILESNLNMVIYLIELQCKNDVELNNIFNVSPIYVPTSNDLPSNDNQSPAGLIFFSRHDGSFLSPTALCGLPTSEVAAQRLCFSRNPVRAGPFAA
jgi:hypothetical protein